MMKLYWYAFLIAFGVAIFYSLKYMPASWDAKLSGWKTAALSYIAMAMPEISDLLTSLQSSGLDALFPTVGPKAMQVVGVALFVVNQFTKRIPNLKDA